jgi:phage terminase small subunit
MTPRQNRFCEEYPIDLNGTQAAIRAGYSKRGADVVAVRLLAKPEIAARVAELMKERSARTQIDADWVLEKAVAVFNRVTQEIEPALHPATRKQLKTKDGRPLFTFNAAAALRALEIVGKHVDVSAFEDRLKIEGEISLIDRIQAARKNAQQSRVIDVTPKPVAALPPLADPRAEALTRAKSRTR